ncbi:MAG: nucleotidyltransferase domain-containing protein [bacterium]
MKVSKAHKTKHRDLALLQTVLHKLRRDGTVLVALLYGSYASGKTHRRSDIDLALYVRTKDRNEEMEVIDRILMAGERDISILRLDDEEESPFVVQEALKGIHLVEPDEEILFRVADRVLHEAETIRFRRQQE